MTAYIVGLIAGAVCMVSPLLYLASMHRGLAEILSDNPEFDVQKFLAYTPHTLLYAVGLIGAVVFLLSAAMAALTGLTNLKERTRLLGAGASTQAAEDIPMPDVDEE